MFHGSWIWVLLFVSPCLHEYWLHCDICILLDVIIVSCLVAVNSNALLLLAVITLFTSFCDLLSPSALGAVLSAYLRILVLWPLIFHSFQIYFKKKPVVIFSLCSPGGRMHVCLTSSFISRYLPMFFCSVLLLLFYSCTCFSYPDHVSAVYETFFVVFYFSWTELR